MDFSKIPSPCFVLDERLLQQNLETIKYLSTETGIHILLALKGFVLWKAFPMVRQYLNGAAASSYNEARLCVEEMHTLAHTYAVAYAPEDFSKIMRLSSHITFNSLAQFEKWDPSVSRFKKHKISCGIRLNLEFSVVKPIENDPSQQGSRLGIDLKKLASLTDLPTRIEGFLVHCLADSPAVETVELLEIIEEKCARFLPKIKWLNLGGGHLLTEKGYDLAYLIEHLNAFKNKYPHIQLILEPSTAIGLNAGFLRSKILDIVDNQGFRTLILDISINAHLINNAEMPVKWRIRNAVLSNEGRYNYRISGASSTHNDGLPNYSFEKEMHIGDDLIFENALNYTMVKSHFSEGINPPSIGILRSDNTFDLLRQFTYSDYKKRLS
jgi:carboxynorspermidine decarboxylase